MIAETRPKDNGCKSAVGELHPQRNGVGTSMIRTCRAGKVVGAETSVVYAYSVGDVFDPSLGRHRTWQAEGADCKESDLCESRILNAL